MLYVINNKCYVNVAPSIYVEVVISKDGKVTPTKNRIEVTSNTGIRQTTVKGWLDNFVEIEPSYNKNMVDKKYNKRRK